MYFCFSGVYCLYAWALRRKLRIQAGRSGWWALPLMLPIIFFPIYGLNSLQARVYLLLTFLVLTPLFFVKWKVKMEEKTRAGPKVSTYEKGGRPLLLLCPGPWCHRLLALRHRPRADAGRSPILKGSSPPLRYAPSTPWRITLSSTLPAPRSPNSTWTASCSPRSRTRAPPASPSTLLTPTRSPPSAFPSPTGPIPSRHAHPARVRLVVAQLGPLEFLVSGFDVSVRLHPARRRVKADAQPPARNPSRRRKGSMLMASPNHAHPQRRPDRPRPQLPRQQPAPGAHPPAHPSPLRRSSPPQRRVEVSARTSTPRRY